MDFSVIIPARYASSRLPEKLLREIEGKALIEHTYYNATKSGAKRVIIATDDERIESVASSFGAEVCMTSVNHANGTSRLSETANLFGFEDNEIIVNVQGDEPLLSSKVINQVADNLQKSDMQVATLCEQITTEELYFDPNCVKVVYNSRGRALYFSRSPIPAFREGLTLDLTLCYRHVGIYAYRVGFLKIYAELATSPLEMAETLEQLTILNEGFDIHVEPACDATGIGVDTEEDLFKVKKELGK